MLSRFSVATVTLLVASALAGCASLVPRANTVRDTSTIHNPEANRIWIIHRVEPADGTAPQEHVLYCDSAFVAQNRPLCVAAQDTNH